MNPINNAWAIEKPLKKRFACWNALLNKKSKTRSWGLKAVSIWTVAKTCVCGFVLLLCSISISVFMEFFRIKKQKSLAAPFLLSLFWSKISFQKFLCPSQQKAQLRCRGFHSFFTQNLGCATTVSDRWVTVVTLMQDLRSRVANKAIQNLRGKDWESNK